MPLDIAPYEIAVPDQTLYELHRRLDWTRWPERETVDDWSQGVPLDWLRSVCEHWRHQYEWRDREAKLNEFDQFVAPIDGLPIHFIHQRSPHEGATPLLLTHGWPGSIVEFDEVIEPLTKPLAHGGEASDAFHVIAPSLPGFGFSGKPTSPGWTVERIAAAFSELMAGLGYDRYLAQGGDWGSSITASIGRTDVEHCAGVHMTLMMRVPPPAMDDLSPTAQAALERGAEFAKSGTGYSKQQSTRPQTLGYGLTDSPVGQAAWILEKFWAWAEHPGDPLEVLDLDRLLDNVMVYWVTATAASSARLYWESYRGAPTEKVEIPSGFTVYPEEIVPPVREWVEPHFTDIRHWAEQPRGGHFAAFEVPDLFVDDIRAFARAVR